jgi:hypothetical protein
MTIERTLRLIAGLFVLGSLALGHWMNEYWYLFTAFVGLNLFQSGFTNWCLMMTFLRKLGVGSQEKLTHACMALADCSSGRIHRFNSMASTEARSSNLTECWLRRVSAQRDKPARVIEEDRRATYALILLAK